jgi:hypothetical protein
VAEVNGSHDEDSPCNSEEGSPGGPYDTGLFVGDYRAEVVHYGPFFIPTGKNVFNCDVASTHNFFLPRDVDGVLFNVLGPIVFIGALGLAVGVLVVPAFLTFGRGVLLARSVESSYRVVGLVALVLGVGLVAAAFLAIA